MAVHKVKRGDRVYLSEYKKIRDGKKVKSIFVRYLGTENQITGGITPKRCVLDKVQLSRSYRAGDVRLLWRIAQDLDFVGIIDRICCQESYVEGVSPGKFLTIWAINRAIDPESCTQLERWVPTTDLPMLAGIEPELFTKDAFLSSLDFVCYHEYASNRLVDHTASLDEALYRRWRRIHPLPPGDKEIVAYDLTSVLFFGVSCPIAELGYNPKHINRRQVNLALLVSKWDRYPLSHFVYNGSRNTVSTVKNLLARLIDTAVEPGTLIWDRANVTGDHVKLVETAGWRLICGVPKNLKEVQNIIKSAGIQPSPSTFVHKSKSEHIYAIRVSGRLFGRERSVVVYENQERRTGDVNALNEVLAEIGKQLDLVSEKGKGWSEAQLHREIDDIAESWKDYLRIRVTRKGNGARILWKFRKQAIEDVKRSYGRYVLFSTDEDLSAESVVKSYFEKDFVEKVFRILRTDEEIEPVRHRLEPRVRAYMFVCVLAYRLLSVLQAYLQKVAEKGEVWERTFDLLSELGRVERVDVGFGKEMRMWYLNKTKYIEDTLKSLGMKDLLKEEIKFNV